MNSSTESRPPIALTAQLVCYCDCVESLEPAVVVIPTLERPGTCEVCGAKWLIIEISHKVDVATMQATTDYSAGKLGTVPAPPKIHLTKPGERII